MGYIEPLAEGGPKNMSICIDCYFGGAKKRTSDDDLMDELVGQCEEEGIDIINLEEGGFLYNMGTIKDLKRLKEQLLEKKYDPLIRVDYHNGVLFYSPYDARWKDEVVCAVVATK